MWLTEHWWPMKNCQFKGKACADLQDVFDDPLLVVVTCFQVLHVELEQVKGCGTYDVITAQPISTYAPTHLSTIYQD